MPCYDPLPEEHARERKQRLNLLTRNLCQLCQDIERSGQYEQFAKTYPELDQWFRQHQKEDEMRRSIKAKISRGEELTDEEIGFGWSPFA